MKRFQKMTALAALSVFASFSSAAQAQLALQNGALVSVSGSQTTGSGITTMDLGNAGSSTTLSLVSKMPMSLTYGSVTANISFTGTNSGLADGGTWAPSTNNYLLANPGGSVTLAFSSTQQYFATRWATKDAGNQISFYNGDQLVASTTGAVTNPMSLTQLGASTGYVDFNFTELGYDRVVATSSGGGFEFSDVSFSADVQVAPIPLNAASLGGLMSFLMMLAMNMKGLRGKGGPQVAIRMAFASIMPHQRGLA